MLSPFSHINIILVRPQHSGNIGAAARSISNHGLGQLLLVNPQEFDPDRARWMAPNAHHIINAIKIYPTLPQALATSQFVVAASARNRKWKLPTLSIDDFCQQAGQRSACAIVFGPEDSGLSNDDLQSCHAIVSLPTRQHSSLNLSHAVSAFGTHLMNSIEEESPVLLDGTIDVAFQHKMVTSAMKVLHSIQFLRGRNPQQVQNHLFRLLERAQPTKDELGSLMSISNKLFHGIRVLKEQITTLSDESQKK